MNPRERVQTALNHHQPDRTPVDFSGHRSSGIAAIAYSRLRNHLGLAERPVRVYDMVQQLAVVDLAGAGLTLRRALDVIPEPDGRILQAIASLRQRGILTLE